MKRSGSGDKLTFEDETTFEVVAIWICGRYPVHMGKMLPTHLTHILFDLTESVVPLY